MPNLRFSEFDGEWEKIALDNIATFSKGNGLAKDDLTQDGKLCILYGELYTKYKSEIINEIDSKTETTLKNAKLSSIGDILIPSSGESALDIACARSIKISNVIIGGDLNVISVGKLNSDFIAYQLNGKRKYDIAKVAQGSSVVHLYNDSLKKINVNIPCIHEMEKISRMLNLLDNKIKLQMKIIEKYKSLIKGIREKLLIGYDMVELSKLIQIISRKNKSDLISSVYSVNNKLGFISQNEQFEDREIASDDKKNYKIVKTGEFAFNPARINVGSIAMSYNLNDVIVSPMYTCFKTKSYLHNKYLNELVKTHYFKYEVVKRLEGSVRLCLSTESLLNIKIPLPPVEIQTEVITHIDILNKYLFNNISLLNECNNLKSFLLLNLFK